MTKNTKYLGKYFVNPPHDKSHPHKYDSNWKEPEEAHKE